MSLVFGPVPSRRLGKSLGINNIPPKACPYSCVYCQLGPTAEPSLLRTKFHPPEQIVSAIGERLKELGEQREQVDTLSFVPDGEPTLDLNLGRTIEQLRPFGINIAVVTSGVLLSRDDVRAELASADWVSLKIDAMRESVWKRTNDPHASLRFDNLRSGMLVFASMFSGTLVTETMLVEGVNTRAADIERTADFVSRLGPDVAYIATATHPVSNSSCPPASAATMAAAYEIFSHRLPKVECLSGFPELAQFRSSGDVRDDLLTITAVHPMRVSEVRGLLRRVGADWSAVASLLQEGQLEEVVHGGEHFLVRAAANSLRPSPRPGS